MVKLINIPNLFVFVGQPNNGKTTCAKWFVKLLGCDVIHTDQVYHVWIAAHHPTEANAARRDIRNHFPRLSPEIKQSWNAYIVKHIIFVIHQARLDVVAEGWLLQFLTDELKLELDKYATTMFISMQRFTAHAHGKTFKPNKRDYSNVVHGLVNLLASVNGVKLIKDNVKYQSFEDIKDFQGSSDSCGKLLALNLPDNLEDKKILDVGCNTGYFSIRCAQRGAWVTGIDKRLSVIKTASRLANTVYRKPNVQFYHVDFFKYLPTEKYDYVLAVDILSTLRHDAQHLIKRAAALLKPDGILVLELALNKEETDCLEITENPKTHKQYVYPNKNIINNWSNDLICTYAGNSIPSKVKRHQRNVYHFSNKHITTPLEINYVI